MPSIRVKRGATLNLVFTFTEPDGSATDLTGSTLQAQIRDVGGQLLADLVFTAGTAANELRATVADTAEWPEGMARCDVVVTQGGVTAISDTFAVHVDRAVTQLAGG